MTSFEERKTTDEVVFENIPEHVCERLINHLAGEWKVGFMANRGRTSVAIPIGFQEGIEMARKFLDAA